MSYSIDDQHGTNICGGLSEHNAHAVAKRHANSMRETVYLYVDGADDEPEAVDPDESEATGDLPTVELGSWRDHMEEQNERIARRGE